MSATEEKKEVATYLPLDYLLEHQNPENPKDHDIGLIIESIERFGFRGAVQFDANSEMLVKGHGTIAALAAMRRENALDPPRKIGKGKEGWLVPVKYESFPDEIERNAYTIAENQTTIRGGWDKGALAGMLEQFAATGDDDAFKGTGFDGDDLDNFLRDLGDERVTPPLAPSAISKVYKSESYGVTVNVETREEQERLVEIIEANGFWAKRHSR